MRRSGNYVVLDDERIFPLVEKDNTNGGIEWRLRYADYTSNPEQLQTDRLVAASIINAYDKLIHSTIKERNRIMNQLKLAD